MSPAERRALLLVVGLGVAGHLLRAGRAEAPPPVVLFDPATDGDPLAHRDRSLALAAPLEQGERVDMDRADARELARLPGVGPAMAQRIVADRQTKGAFGDTAALGRVAGIGPATLTRLAPHLRFSASAADPTMARPDPLLSLNQATATELEQLPGIGPRRASAIIAFRDSAGPFREVGALARVPGVSESLVQRLRGLVRVP